MATQKTANEEINFLDIKNNLLYTKDGYLMAYLIIEPKNIDLITEEELQVIVKRFTASFEEDRNDFTYFFLPREINLDSYKKNLKNRINNETSTSGRKKILEEMLKECVDLTSNKENYEHQAYLKIWKKIGSNESDTIRNFNERITLFVNRYKNNGFKVRQANKQEILQMCNLYANPDQASSTHINPDEAYETAMYL